ncbi:glycosyltransferase family 2 protein [Mesoflavibacter profundi]|uniref:glycosyltransferase family 2 protein n=1 Tax=Mesoflavibacter profundi TaxID=2708110 RepID=UPI003515747D
MSSDKTYSLIIYMPALNEAASILNVLKSLPKKIEGISTIQYLVVDDGSTDNTAEIAKSFGANVISHSYNRGVGKAFQTAVDFALKTQADILVSIDADGQFDVNQITNMINPIITNQADFCIGNRFYNKRPDKMPKVKYWGNKRVNSIVSLVGKTKIEDASCGFRAYSKDCLLNLNLQGDFTYTHETILDLLNKGFNINQIPVKVKYFEDRVSRVANSLVQYAVKTSLIIFKCLKDYRPLRFFLSIALFVLVLGLLLGGFVFIHWLNKGMITPYKSIGFIALALCGMSVFIATLAFVADMLNRIRDNQEKILVLLKKDHFNSK